MANPTIDAKQFIGRDLGTVTILEEIGRGASGAVFLGFQRTLKRQVAVKVMLKSSRTNETSREQFRQEAEMVAVLSHPNIIPIFEMGEADDCYYQVIQVVQGQDLDTMIRRRLKNPIPARRLLPRDESISMMVQILDGLGYAHSEGVVHQDIKPANVLVEKRMGRPLIADFGIARTKRSEISREGVVVGSPLFMAPEQVANKETDQRTDIYSAGVMLYQMLAGVLPVAEKEPMRLLVKKIEAPGTEFTVAPSKASPLIDKELEAIILHAIAPSPDKRFGTCEEMARDLQAYAKS